MLPSLNQATTRFNWRTIVFLVALATVTLALPTLRGMTRPIAAVVVLDDSLPAAQAEEKSPTASKAEPTAVEYLPRPSKIEEKIIAALRKPTTVEFIDLPLEDCITFMKDYHNINLWLDKTTLTEEAVPLDQPITLKLADVSLRSVLQLLLEPLQLTYVIEDDVMKITPITHARKKMITRTYPVSDLYPERNKAEEKPAAAEAAPKGAPSGLRLADLERAITRAVDPESWDETKGPASITYVKESRSLVIRQHWGAHMKIVELVRDLREAKRTATGEKK